MFSLAEKIKKQQSEGGPKLSDAAQSHSLQQAKVRDQLLLKEVKEMLNTLPPTCKIDYPDPNKLYEFNLFISPDAKSLWYGGKFRFKVLVPEEYNMHPPEVRCLTRIWHPNIDEEGNICLSILRRDALDSNGWLPTRTVKEVVWGLNSLFSDLCDFNDALNTGAADHYRMDPDGFRRKVQQYISQYCS